MHPPESATRFNLLYWSTATLCLLLLASGLHLPLFDLDEGAFAEASREMLQNRDFLFITLDGQPRPDKPILIYWLQALSVSLLGQQEWAWRLPSVVASALWLLAIWRFARTRMPESLALQAALLTLTSAGVAVISHAATADALFNLWLTLTAVDMARYFEQSQRSTARRVWLWMGLGFLTKGPAALVIPTLPALWHAWREQKMSALWLALRLPSGWLLFLLVSLPWYALVWWQHGPQLLLDFFLDHNLGRFTRTMEGHGGHWWYYFMALPLVLLPYSGLLAELLLRGKSGLQEGWQRLAVRWLLVAFVLFSLSGTQLPHYMLYGLPLLFPMLTSLGTLPADQWRARVIALLMGALPFVFWLLLSLFSPLLVQHLKPGSLEALMFSANPDILYQPWPILLLLTVLAGAALVYFRRQPVTALVLSGILHVLLLQQIILPAVANLQQAPVKQAALLARQAAAPVVAWRIYMPSFSVYRQQVTPHRLPKAGEWVFTRKDRLHGLQQALADHSWQTVYDGGAIVLLKPEKTAP